MTADELVGAWRANQRIGLALLDLCADQDLDLKPGKGKTIRSALVHLVGVRKMWLEDNVKAEAAAIPNLDWKTATRAEIVDGLERSSLAMEQLLRRRAERECTGKWTAPLFFAYAIAHEAHHRSQIEIALRINGREPDDAKLYALWEWQKFV